MRAIASTTGSLTLEATGLRSAQQVETIVGDLPPQVDPLQISVAAGGTQTFTAHSGKPPYTWDVETNASGGSIDNLGHYTAGDVTNVQDVVRVTDSNGATGEAFVTIDAAIDHDWMTRGNGGFTSCPIPLQFGMHSTRSARIS